MLLRRPTLTILVAVACAMLSPSALLAEDLRENVWPAVAEGELRPAMDRIFPLAQAAAAHARMESGEHIGKIVLEVMGEAA